MAWRSVPACYGGHDTALTAARRTHALQQTLFIVANAGQARRGVNNLTVDALLHATHTDAVTRHVVQGRAV